MRTTLMLDDDVAAFLQAEARKNGQSFKATVNRPFRAQGQIASELCRRLMTTVVDRGIRPYADQGGRRGP